ncbi:hypothetical protein BofuT4_uP059940.1 [Botrytis cinerea T4]|uniref:Uncharacterized protein n=1 Tax=Botryotinia fuckeliana (strain T4) TaxID=999810 RepID=G2XUA5_BOTF4|nr:hypothetical protein BofuT4_uP059940.1 [Botrytis cinerea T4]
MLLRLVANLLFLRFVMHIANQLARSIFERVEYLLSKNFGPERHHNWLFHVHQCEVMD